VQTFEGHSHYVMSLAINPKDTNTFASACLDRTVKIWSLGGAGKPNYTLEAHETKGVNHVDYYPAADKPYILTTSDDRTIKIWDYTTKALVATLEGHTSNVSFACYHPELPVIVSGSEDGTIKIWHANTHRLEQTLNYNLERAWCVSYQKGKNGIGIGFDDGVVVIKMGREEPAISMDQNGKLIWAKQNEVVSSVVRPGDATTDGESLILPTKDLGTCEVFPSVLKHSPNGRFVAVCGDGEYIIYTSLAWRNKEFGSALDFVWSTKDQSTDYAIRESSTSVKIFKNFKERPEGPLDVGFSAEGLFGGFLLAVKGNGFVALYDWDSGELVRRIDVVPTEVSAMIYVDCCNTNSLSDLLVGRWRALHYRLRRHILCSPLFAGSLSPGFARGRCR
jgi:coatomer subunit beta'